MKKKHAKRLGIALIILIVLLILGIGATILLTNPNHFKPLIEKQLTKLTAQTVTINGSMEWSFRGGFGIKAADIQVRNEGGFPEKNLITIQKVVFGAELLPLLYKDIKLTHLKIDGMSVYLNKNKNGKTNWENLQKNLSGGKKLDEKNQVDNNKVAFSIEKLTISNGSLQFQNEEVKQTYLISNIDLKAENINSTSPITLTLNFNLADKQKKLLSDTHIEGDIDLTKTPYQFTHLKLRAAYFRNQNLTYPISLTATGNFVPTSQILNLTDISGSVSDLNLQGNAKLMLQSKTNYLSGKFNLRPNNKKIPANQMLLPSNMLGNFNSDVSLSSGSDLQSLNAKGDIKTARVNTDTLAINNFRANFNYNKNNLTVSNFTGQVANGNLRGQANVTLNQTPNINLQATLANVKIEDLMQSPGSGRVRITGRGDINLNINTRGTNANDLMQNLNGSGRLNFKDGMLVGIDVPYLVFTAYAMAKHSNKPSKQSQGTPYRSLTATFTIRNGNVNNQDLVLDARGLNVKGSGNINLARKNINYRLLASINNSTDSKNLFANLFGFGLKNSFLNLYGISVPILIAGNLNQPSIALDMKTFLVEVSKKVIETTVTTTVTGGVGAIVPIVPAVDALKNMFTK